MSHSSFLSSIARKGVSIYQYFLVLDAAQKGVHLYLPYPPWIRHCIGCVKQYHALSSVIPLNIAPYYANHIWYICCALSLFHPTLVVDVDKLSDADLRGGSRGGGLGGQDPPPQMLGSHITTSILVAAMHELRIKLRCVSF